MVVSNFGGKELPEWVCASSLLNEAEPQTVVEGGMTRLS